MNCHELILFQQSFYIIAISMEQTEQTNFPHYLSAFADICLCPIGLQIMQTPYTISQCGHTFEHDFISSWLNRHTTCPLCRIIPKEGSIGFINEGVLEAIRILRLLQKKPDLLIPLYQPMVIFIRDEQTKEMVEVQVYLEDIVATILVKYSVKMQKMAQFKQGGRRLLYKDKLLKGNLLVEDYNIQPYSLLVYTAKR